MDGLRRTLSTCSDDRTIRVWDIDSMRQLYDFATPDDSPTAVCCHPLLEVSRKKVTDVFLFSCHSFLEFYENLPTMF